MCKEKKVKAKLDEAWEPEYLSTVLSIIESQNE